MAMSNPTPLVEAAAAAMIASRDESLLPRPRGSPSDEAALAHLARHMAEEQAILADYLDLAEQSEDEHVRFLIGLIVDDETRHHQLLTDMFNRVEADLAWRRGEHAIPWFRTPRDPEALTEATRRFIGIERRDRTELRRLRKELRRKGTSLLPLVVELMELDTAKHLRILEFLRASTRQ
jgi:rubrerythrin